VLRDQLHARDLLKLGISDLLVQVAEGELLRLGFEMDALRAQSL
jgi:hypothetical protein